MASAAVVLSAAPLAWAATPDGLAVAYAAFAVVLAAGAAVALRATGATRPA